MSQTGPFDRVWALLRDTALRPGPALAYLLLLALAWPAYRLWTGLPPPGLREPAVVPAVVAVAAGATAIRLPPNAPVLLRVPTAGLAARPASLALTVGGRDRWSVPLGVPLPAEGGILDVVLDGTACADADGGVLEFRGDDGAILARYEVALE